MIERLQLEGLGPEQLEFLRRRLLKSAKKEESRILKIVRQSRATDTFPLSYAQRRLWFADRLEPGNPAYNVGILARLDGVLDRDLLVRVVEEIFRRHEILRTTFAWVGQDPMQVISPAATVELPLVDLSALPAGRRAAEAELQAAAGALRPFALDRGPLLRLTLFRQAASAQLLLVAFHHIVSDGWAFGIFVRELAAIYEAFHHGAPSPLPELAVQYVDFAHWQRQWLEGKVFAEQLAYWQDRLAGVPPALELPADRPRKPVLGYRGRRAHRVVPAALENGLERLAESCGATLFMVLLAGFQALLFRYTGQRDFAVGSPIANRHRKETEGLMGFFANTLVLRADLSGPPTFRQALARAQETAMGAFAAQDLPFERLVEELRPERDLSHQPVFQVMFALQNFELAARSLPGLTLEPVDWELGMSHFDLTLFVTPEKQRLLSTVRYNRDLFDAPTAARLLGHLTHLLAGAVRDPDRPLADYGLLGEAECHQVVHEWGGAGGPPGSGGRRILDEAGRPVPIGVVGHLWDGDRPTGELARFCSSGRLEPLGAADRQIRIRGFRVDPGEVAARLARHPGVAEAAVAVREYAGAARLVAYLTAAAGDAPTERPTERELRAALRLHLPDYAVPTAFVAVASLPWAADGTLDLAALPLPAQEGAEAAAMETKAAGALPGRRRPESLRFRQLVAPRTPSEAALTEIFLDVLGLDSLGVHDSFFELGGHSLLGTVLMTRVREAFGIDLPVLRLFEAPTVEELAALVDAGREAAAPAAALAPILPFDPAPVSVEGWGDDQVNALLAELLAERGRHVE